MDDEKVPPLNYLYFYITDGCNLRCRHCWIEPHQMGSHKAITYLPSATFSAIIAEAIPLGLRGVKLSGGEPLIHPHLREMLTVVEKFCLELTVETNGTLLTPEIVSRFRALPSVTISVSLDGAQPQTTDWIRNVRGTHLQVVKGIELLAKASLSPQIIFTLMKWNRAEVIPLVNLAYKLGAGSVKINCLQPVARGERIFSEGAVDIEEILALNRLVDEELSSEKLPVSVHLPPAFRPLSRLFGEKGNGCSTCGIMGILGVLADGSYALCGIGETVKEMVFGLAGRDSLAQVWRGHAVLREIRGGLPHRLQGICGRCALKGVCLGSCIAQSFYRTHSLWAPFWFCEEAEKKGLFPLSRIA
ncbi:MAG TPA: SynChlorMet cassette radical SAM/SPASM protein ScmF [Syntrophales bacterium]|nr:SynChlorMet cassette radical SAM/SPASM protein ScmF [Syntrophales bacterium]